MNPNTLAAEQIAAEQQRFMVKVYGWMGLGLVITGFVAMYTASTEELLSFILSSRWMLFGLIILELVAVGMLVGLINKMSASMATMVFLLYALLNGLTMSLIFVIYTTES